MLVEGTRLLRTGKRAAVAALASVLLASCSTSETEPFGFAVPSPVASASQASDFNSTTVDPATSAEVPPAQFVMDENDPVLPDQVVDMPSLRPGSEGEMLALQATQPQTTPSAVELVASEAGQTAPQQPTTLNEQLANLQAAEQAVTPPAQPEQPEATQFIENAPSQQIATAAPKPEKRGFLSALFGSQPARAAPQPVQPLIASTKAAEEPAKPLLQLASANPSAARPMVSASASPLPGVRDGNSLFEISRRSGMDDDSDIDLYEDSEPYEVASAAGMARLAPNGLVKQTERVDVACLKPSLVRMLKSIEAHYGTKAVVTSGYRNPHKNRRARGARNSLHMYCAAADIQVEGISKWDLAAFVRTMPGRGGVGTYCHTNSVHVDVGPERDWNWRCRRRK